MLMAALLELNMPQTEAMHQPSHVTPPCTSPCQLAQAAGDVAPNVAQARQWIASWKAKQGGASSAPAAGAAAAAGTAAATGDVLPNVTEAQQWIAGWKAKQGGGGEEEAPMESEEQEQAGGGNDLLAGLNKLFGGFGGNKQ